MTGGRWRGGACSRRARAGVLAALVLVVVAGTGDAAPVAAQGDGEGAVTLRVVGGVPGEPVDVLVDGERLVRDLRFGEVSPALPVPPGRPVVTLRPAGRSGAPPAVEGAVRAPAGHRVTVAFALDELGLRRLRTSSAPLAPPPAGEAELEVHHLGALPEVELRGEGRVLVPRLATGGRTAVTLPAGPRRLAVRLAGGERAVLGPEVARLRAGTTTQVFVLGSARAGRVRLAVQPLAPVAEADVPGSSSRAGEAGRDDGRDRGPGWQAVLATVAAAVVVSALVLPALGARRRGGAGLRRRLKDLQVARR